MRKASWPRCVTLQIDWTTIPRKRLRRQSMLQSAVDDVLVGARFLQREFPGKPLVLVGFSFGGPAVWPAALTLLREAAEGCRPLAGVCSIAGSAREGDAYADAGLATKACVHGVGAEGGGEVAALFLQGTHDKNVALQVAEYLVEAARPPACLARVNYGPHMMDTCRSAAYPFLRDWTIDAISRWGRRRRRLVATSSSDTEPRPNQDEDGKAAETKLAGSLDGEEAAFCRAYGRPVRLGRPLEPRANEVEGKERWRRKPSKKRLQKIRCDPDHVLAGLVGFSM